MTQVLRVRQGPKEQMVNKGHRGQLVFRESKGSKAHREFRELLDYKGCKVGKGHKELPAFKE